MELDDEEEDMVPVMSSNMWSKGKGVQDASEDQREPYEIIDDQDVQSVASKHDMHQDQQNSDPINIDSNVHSEKTSNKNSQSNVKNIINDNDKDDTNTKDKPSGKKKSKKSEIKTEIFKALEYDFESKKSTFTIVIEPKVENQTEKHKEKGDTNTIDN